MSIVQEVFGVGGDALDAKYVHSICLANGGTSTYTIDPSKKYIVYVYLSFTDNSHNRSSMYYIDNGVMSDMIEAETDYYSGTASLNGTTLTLTGIHPTYRAWFDVVQLD